MPEENKEKKNSFIKRYAVNFTEQQYVVNPAIGREKEIKELSLILLTPDKSAILTGKPGIGKTAIVEGLAYLIQRNEVPNALKGYTIIKIDTQALMGTVKETGDSRVQTLIDEIAEHEKYILFIDEIHTLVNATSESALDFAQMFKTGLGRGDLKVIGATTSAEYEKYILRDKAFTRRFQKVEVAEPDVEMTVKIVTGVIPRIEKSTGIKMGYTPFIQEKLARFVTELTTEYNRVYETAGRYPDVAITLFSNAFSEALFDNKNTVTAAHVRKAIEHSKAVYPDVIKKYLPKFDQQFDKILKEEASGSTVDIAAIENEMAKEDESSVETTTPVVKPVIPDAPVIEETHEVSTEEDGISKAIDNIINTETRAPENNNNSPVVDTPSVTTQADGYININNTDSQPVDLTNYKPEPNSTNIDQKIKTLDSLEELYKAYDRITDPFDNNKEV